MAEILLKAEKISKEFSGVRVLNNIDFQIEKGKIFGIIGENGAGKSTLIKIISGIYHATAGELYFEGEKVSIKSPQSAKEIGISTIPQEFNLIPELNVFENIFLGKEYVRKNGLLDKKLMVEKTRELMDELKTDISPFARISDLSVAQKQMVEFAKALAYDSKLLIMDEPSTVLTQNEIEVLFSIVKRLKERNVSIIYISHKLKEIKELCDEFMVLRDGEFIAVRKTSESDEQEMATLMVGRELSQIFPEKVKPEDEIVLKVEGISVDGLLRDVSFELRKGEILGFSGLVGSGRTELAEAIIGVRKRSGGRIFKNGKELKIRTSLDSVNNKIAYLSEDRQGIGILTNYGVTENITLTSLRNYSRILINHRKEREKAEFYVKEFDIKAASLKTKLEFFSGGNQQKVSLAKSLDTQPDIFIIDEPTRGIDVNAKREIYFFIKKLVEDGISCIIISSEMEEIIGMCNRVVVMRNGRISGVIEERDISEQEIMFYATGIKGVA